MKELGKLKDRFDVSLDSRQFGLALFGAALLAALVFVLGVSVGLQWEKRKVAEAKALAMPPAPVKAALAVPPAPVAPPVYTPVTTAAAKPPAPAPDDGKKDGQKAAKDEKAKDDKQLDDLTFPKVLTSDNKSTQPLTSEKTDKKKQAAGGKYSVQVAAFNDAASAKARAGKLTRMGYEARVFVADKSKGAYRYKVRVGNFSSKEEAAGAAKKLKAREKVSPYIVKE